jgi:hypothetical protein
VSSKFYDTDDPEAPTILEEWNGLKPGMHVVYRNPAWRTERGYCRTCTGEWAKSTDDDERCPGCGSWETEVRSEWKTGGMDPPLVIDELVRFDMEDTGWVEAVLNGGEWQCAAANLVPDPDRP